MVKVGDMATGGPRNITLWVIGPDSAPEALEIEQTDGNVYPLCTFSQVQDATFLGWLLSKYAVADGLDLQFSSASRLGES